jgi:hypothetical protein
MITSARTKNSPLKFIAFVYVLSIPFCLLGTGNARRIPAPRGSYRQP